MKDDLKETFYCDYNCASIRQAASELSQNSGNPDEIAKKTFYYVRDNITYGLDLFMTKASETLKKGYGVCWNKSLLLVALLRCNSIPARFGSIPLKRRFSKPAAGLAYLFTNNPYNHGIAHVFLNEKWIVLDAVFDQKTFDTCYQASDIQWGIEWDGVSDCRLYTEDILGPPEMHFDIDATLKKKIGNTEWPKFFAKMTNAVINKRLWKRTGFQEKPYKLTFNSYTGES